MKAPIALSTIAALVGLLTLLAMPGCGEEKVLTLRYWQAATLPSPYLASGFKDSDAAALTLEPLASYDPDGNLVPRLAVEVPTVENGGVSADLTSITWSLRDDAKWSDGSDFSASDVVFTWRYCTDEATGCVAEDNFEGISDVTAVDDRTVRVEFDAPTPFPYSAFVSSATPIISEAQFRDCVGAAASGCEEQNAKPLGTGPFRIVEFASEERAEYERNPHYWGDRPYFDRVIIEGGGDAESAARAALESGTVDYGWNLQVPPEMLASLEAQGVGRVVSSFAGLTERLVLNQTNVDPALGDDRSEYLDGANPHPFLSFHPVRQAMSLAIDRTRLAEELYGFAGRPACNLVEAPVRYRSSANDGCVAQDIAGAQRLLDENGVVDSDGDGVREHNGVPLRVTYQTTENTVRQGTQELIQGWWREVGIEATLVWHNAGVFFGGDPSTEDASYRRFLADVQMYATDTGIDPASYLNSMGCEHIQSRENNWADGNNSRGCNPAFDALLPQLDALTIGAERDALVKQMNDIYVQNYFEIFLVDRGLVSAHANDLKGVRMNAWDSELWNIAEWRR
ncbi:MAG: peptide ABC transporter substrate-binding protein [Chloroflexota bacterium]|nr:peptide ABC transporter substrate-binding protein [Chloroflexota bacterium]